MAGPWEKYGASPTATPTAPAATGPWAKYGATPATTSSTVTSAPPAAPPTVPIDATQAATPEAPWYQQAGQAADDIVRLIANGVTFGYADKLAGRLNGTGTETERNLSRAAAERAGSAGTVAEIGGAMAVPVTAAGAGLTMAGRLGTGAMRGATGLAARSGLMAAEGAGYGALSAAGHDQSLAEGATLGAIGGAAGNVAGEAVAAGLNKAGAIFNPNPQVPSVEDLTNQARQAYQAAEAAGVIYSPQATDRLRNTVTNDLSGIGYDPALQPGAGAVVRRLEELNGQNVTLTGLDTLRKVASNGFIPGNRSNNVAIARIVDRIDEIATNPAAGDVLNGNGEAAANALSTAREAWSRVAKVGRVEDAVNRADLRAASTGSGGNVDNATRQNLRRLAENPRGFTPDEMEALVTAVRGTPGQNALRLAGKFAPTGVVSGMLSGGVGVGALGPAGLAIPAAGAGAKYLADRATQNNVDELIRIIQAGGSRAATVAPPNAAQRLSETVRDPLIQAIMGASAYRAGGGGS